MILGSQSVCTRRYKLNIYIVHLSLYGGQPWLFDNVCFIVSLAHSLAGALPFFSSASYLSDCLLRSKSDSWPVNRLCVFFSFLLDRFLLRFLSHCFIDLYLIHFGSMVVPRNFCSFFLPFRSVLSFGSGFSFHSEICSVYAVQYV